VTSAGDIFEVAPERAAYLYSAGAAEVLDVNKIPADLRREKMVRPKLPDAPPDPLKVFTEDDPARSVRLSRETFIGTVSHPAGTVVTVPQTRAKHLVQAGCGELTTLSDMANLGAAAVKAVKARVRA
jgi:hypothetical protein